MQIASHVETLDLVSAAVVDEEVSHESGVERVAQDNCGFDPDSKQRDVCTDPDTGEGGLVPFYGGCDIVMLPAAAKSHGFRGFRER